MRILNAERTLLLEDIASNTSILLSYRLPTTDERVQYSAGLWKKIGNEVTSCHAEVRAKFGLQILTGIRDGDFGTVHDSEVVPLSGNPGSEHYDQNWKDIISLQAEDVLIMLGKFAFEDALKISPQNGQAAGN